MGESPPLEFGAGRRVHARRRSVGIATGIFTGLAVQGPPLRRGRRCLDHTLYGLFREWQAYRLNQAQRPGTGAPSWLRARPPD